MDLKNFTDVLGDNDDEIGNSQPLSLSLTPESETPACQSRVDTRTRNEISRPARGTGQQGEFRSVEEIDSKYRNVFSYPFFNLVQSSVLDDALYSDKSMVVCAPTGSGKTVVFEMAIVQLLMELDDKNYNGDFKIIYMAPVKALCSERLSEWYPKFTRLGLNCIEVTGDTNVDFSQLKPYRIIITTPEKWDMLTRRWRDNKSLVEVIKLFLIDEVHILNDDTRGPVLEAVVSRMKTIESSSQSAHRIEQLQKQYQTNRNPQDNHTTNTTSVNASMPVRIRFIAVSATVSNPEDVAAWLGTRDKPAFFYKFGDECRPVKLKRVVEGYPCSEGTSIFKFDIILNYKLWPVIQKYHDGKPTLIFCNTRKSVAMTAETLSKELTVSFTPEQQARLTVLASTIKNKKLQALVLSGVGCHHAGLLFEERLNIEKAFRNRDLPILITTTTLAMGVNLPAHLVIIKNTQQYVNGAYQEYSISTVLQMVGRAGRPQFDTEATAVIMTRLQDKPRYQALVGGDEPLQSYLHKRLPENLNSEAALGTVCDVAQCVQWVRSTFLSVRAAKDPKRYLGLPQNAPPALISKKIEELCVMAMNRLATSGLITMDEASCIESTEAGRLMSVYYLDLETMKHIMKIEGTESLEKLLQIVCESHELADMHLRMDERRTLNTLNRNNAAATIRFPMKGKINTRQMKLSCIIQAILGCLLIPEPSLNQEAMKVMRIADRVCKCLVAYVTRPDLISTQPQYFSAIVNTLILAKCVEAHLWENSPYVSKQLKGIGPTFSTLLATAGKVNFILLEESHPRDLERIMNKGAPAGNVLRKQVSLLPKYQLTATPIDEKRISIQLLLLNQHQLAENRDQLTAGDSHKCYVVVGDSENNLLLFTSFKDKDLISVYDGAITYEITRKHNYEHKILIHCISSNWVGIDVHCEYLFKNIESPRGFLRGEAINPMPIQDSPRTTTKKQTSITDVYKERKRKSNDVDFTESKEKKKRDTALVEKFKVLKNSFEATSKELKQDLAKSAHMSNMIINRMINPEQRNNFNETTKGLNNNFINPAAACDIVTIDDDGSYSDSKHVTVDISNDYPVIGTIDLNDDDDFVVDDHINNIMNEIETDILKSTNNPRICANAPVIATPNVVQKNELNVESTFFTKPTPRCGGNNSQSHCNPKQDTFFMASKSSNENKKRKSSIYNKTNYSFIDKIEKNVALDNDVNVPQKDSGFSDAIKNQIEKFLQSTIKKETHDITIRGLLNCAETIENISSSQNAQSTSNITNNFTSTEHNAPLPSDFSAVSTNNDNLDKAVQQFVITPPEISKHTDKNKEAVNNENPIHSELQNIDKIVEDIEREYKNIATKESNFKEEEERSNVNNIYDTKSVETISDYSKNVYLIKQESNKFKAEYSEISSENTSNSNIDAIKLQAVENRKSLADSSVNIITNNRVVPLTKTPKTLENKQKEYKESLLKLHSTITRKPAELLLQDNYGIKVNNVISNSHLYPITQTYSFTSKEPLQFRNQNYHPLQTCNKLQNRNQMDDHNRKYLNNMLVPILPKVNSSQITCKSYPNNFSDNDYSMSEDTAENENNKNNGNTTLVPTPNENSSRTTCKNYPNKFTDNNYRASEDTIENENNNKYGNNMLVPIPNEKSSHITCKSYPNNLTDNDYRASEDATQNEKTNNHIKRYSFSATKIDVSTKNLPDQDHQVQIIRKLKLDVDVTEIVSKGRNRETTNGSEFTKDNTYYQIDELESGQPKLQKQRYATYIDTDKILQSINKERKLPVKDHQIHRQYSIQNPIYNNDTRRSLMCTFPSNDSLLESQNIRNVKESVSTNTSIDEEYAQRIQMNGFLTNAKNYLPLLTQSNELVETKEIDGKNNLANNVEDNELKLKETLSPRTEFQANKNKIEDIEQYKKYLREIAGANCDTDKSCKPETEEKNTHQESLVTERINAKKEQCNEANEKSNKIENILYKYSAILRKNNLHNSADNNIHDHVHDVIRPPLEKTKKIYKISDIHKVNIPLPKNLITVEASRAPKPTNDCTVPILDNERYENNTPKRNENPQNEAITIPEIKTIEQMESFEDKLSEIIPEYHSPDVGNSQEHATDFDLDQSMFNPKLLLEQCFSKDESNVILPPPTEFCDAENIYSPVLEDSFQEYNYTEQGGTSNCDQDKNIFDEDTHSVLTPSVEIETWTLDREEDNKYNGDLSNPRLGQYNRLYRKDENTDFYNTPIFNHNSYNANKSCTVLRRNHNVSTDLSQSQDFEINSRQGKLGYFKLTQKKKFKM